MADEADTRALARIKSSKKVPRRTRRHGAERRERARSKSGRFETTSLPGSSTPYPPARRGEKRESLFEVTGSSPWRIAGPHNSRQSVSAQPGKNGQSNAGGGSGFRRVPLTRSAPGERIRRDREARRPAFASAVFFMRPKFSSGVIAADFSGLPHTHEARLSRSRSAYCAIRSATSLEVALDRICFDNDRTARTASFLSLAYTSHPSAATDVVMPFSVSRPTLRTG